MKFLYILRAKSKSATIQSTRGNPFSELEKIQMMSILNENPNIRACLSESKKSVSVYYSSPKLTVDSEDVEADLEEVEFDLEGFIRTALPRKQSKSEIIRNEKLMMADEKKAIHKKQTQQYLKDNSDVKDWVYSLIGECTLNTYNICALIRFLKGDDKEFSGIFNWKCLIALQAHELADVDGVVNDVKLRDYFKANFKKNGLQNDTVSPQTTLDAGDESVDSINNALSTNYANVTSDTYIYLELEKVCDHAWIELSDIVLKNNRGESTILHADSCSLESEATYDVIRLGLSTDYEAVKELSGVEMPLNLNDLNNITATVKVNDGDIGYENTIVKSSIMFPTGKTIALSLVY
ncbi:hypothetical protein [Aliivibrio fischeri]|uniref:hypothetical protein n=1 Tax=Aliivibrio fischeri TaxID=668 RepID=UPI0012D9B4E9|nr:hypothetical protein [Aliivibrio fischeri]MUJ20477.1 hypothetical protein [Aliivibrio fischeri]